MKYIKYLAILISLFVISCEADETIIHESVHKSNQIQLVTRILPFTEYDVATRADDNQELIYDFIIFGTDGKCVYYNHSVNEIINIDRSKDFSGINQNQLKECKIYVVVNYPAIYHKITNEAINENETEIEKYIKDNIIGQVGLEYFVYESIPVAANVNIPESNLPRYGMYSDTVDLSLEADIVSGTIYTINLQALYAKMVFNIKVDPTEKNPDIYNSNTFQLTGYTINNLAAEVDFLPGTENSSHDNINLHENTVKGVLGNDVDQSATTDVTFSFYLPERFFQPTTTADNFKYPFGSGDNIREEDKEHRQRYKPLLGKGHSAYNSAYNENNDNKATYVTISGIFTDHQGHTFDVDYDIYVGNDNYSNFDIVRNRQYNNNITIKGINNSSDQSSDETSISIDHRVNIDHTLPLILSLRRETLLDAHFEVRPLRIKRNPNHSGEETHVKVEVIYDNDVTYPDGNGNWIGLERSFGNGIPVAESDLYCVGDGSSAGKRKYFTYDLVDASLSKGDQKTDESRPLHTSTNILLPITKNMQECVWIYVDECTQASPDKDAKRKATIRVTCGKVINSEFTPIGESLDYVINQHYLFECTYENRIYHIEHEEEYLHNFDAEDDYVNNQTQEEGMVWGLYNTQLSFDNPALYVDGGILDEMTNYINAQIQNAGVKPFYDFYIPKHDTEVSETAIKRAHRGWVFCSEIIDDINTGNKVTGYSGKIGAIAMDELPTSAIEYVYNRNKRNKDGSIASLDWYLPAIDEMEDIMMGGNKYFEDFLGKFYWSCQPSFLPNYAYHSYTLVFWPITRTGIYYVDDIGLYDNGDKEKGVRYNNGYARATKAEYAGNNAYVYAKSGTTGYDNAIKATGTNGSATFQYTGKFDNNNNIILEDWKTTTMESITRQPGNFERNTKNRVRCVRRSDYTNTSPE